MAELTFDVESVPALHRGALVRVSGAIDAKTVVVFQDRLDNLQSEGYVNYILDMEGIKYVNSTGLGTLVNVADSLENAGGGMALVKIHPKVKVVFDMLGLNAFFQIFKNENDARVYLQDGNGASKASSPPASSPSPPASMPSPPASPPRGSAAPSATVPGAPSSLRAQGGPGHYSVPCKNCRVNLTIKKPGSYKCPRCSSFFKLIADGTVQFFQRNKAAPIQMRLSCTEECRVGLGEFLTVLARRIGFDPVEIEAIRGTVSSVCGEIIETAYQGQPHLSYQVVITPSSTDLRVQFSDYGRFVEGSAAFRRAAEVMDTFEHKPHPKGGNIVTLTKRI